MPWFESVPLTVFGVMVLALLAAAVEAGYHGHRWLARREARRLRSGGRQPPGDPPLLETGA